MLGGGGGLWKYKVLDKENSLKETGREVKEFRFNLNDSLIFGLKGL